MVHQTPTCTVKEESKKFVKLKRVLIICEAKTKALISCAVSVSVFAHVKSRFSHDKAHMSRDVR